MGATKKTNLVRFEYKDQVWFESIYEKSIYRELSFTTVVGQDHRSLPSYEIDSKTNCRRVRHFTVVSLSRP
jgi:hypothetical protein